MLIVAVAGMTACHERYVTYDDAEYIMFADTIATYPVQQDVEYFNIPVVSTVARDYDRTIGVEIIDKETMQSKMCITDFSRTLSQSRPANFVRIFL